MDDERVLSKNRIEALTDGIFAVVMTILVLDISVPQYHLILLLVVVL
jgi:uncharacterized membrane protein